MTVPEKCKSSKKVMKRRAKRRLLSMNYESARVTS